MTTIASDWNDINAVVDYIRALRHANQINSLRGRWAGRAPQGMPHSTRKNCKSWSY